MGGAGAAGWRGAVEAGRVVVSSCRVVGLLSFFARGPPGCLFRLWVNNRVTLG